MTGFERLHPAVQYHVANSLGWPALRPVQDRAAGPVCDGGDVLVLAPTSGGKTEAAVFPLLSRMLAEDWRGLSVLYVCPIRALLNNLHPRLEHYAGLVGRRCGLWHGDVPPGERRRMLDDPPELLLTTPESLEVLLTLKHKSAPDFLRNVRAAVVDETHAFAGDDRGWHLLAVLGRVAHAAGRPVQRVGLSATVGNPAALLDWLAAGNATPRTVIDATVSAAAAGRDFRLDFVGSLDNAARVIAQLHRGQKRLVFCDSRARVEQLSARLRELEVETFVSHSSLAAGERRDAEAAFAGRSDCVIVATSTLELGIDVGDLDRVIQIDAPATAASVLQRAGRTGRRAGTRSNCLFLATSPPALLQAAGLLRLLDGGAVEDVTPPPLPLHLLGQQLLAQALRGGVAVDEWQRPYLGIAGIGLDHGPAVLRHLIDAGFVTTEAGVLGVGDSGDEAFGRRHFLELLSVFTTPPLLRVLHGRREIGLLEPLSFARRGEEQGLPVIQLAGRDWQVTHLDYRTRVAQVVPADRRGKSVWMGGGAMLGPALCRAMHGVLTGADDDPAWSRRATEAVAELRQRHDFLTGELPLVLAGELGTEVWTFAGLLANATLAEGLRRADAGDRPQIDNLKVRTLLAADRVREVLSRWPAEARQWWPRPQAERFAESLKFKDLLPAALLAELARARFTSDFTG